MKNRLRYFVSKESLIAIGIVLFIITAISLLAMHFMFGLFRFDLVSTESTIVRVAHTDDRRGPSARVYVDFTDKNGVEYKNIMLTYGGEDMKEGETLTILYSSNDPKGFVCASDRSGLLVFVLIDAVFVAGGIALLFVSRGRLTLQQIRQALLEQEVNEYLRQ